MRRIALGFAAVLLAGAFPAGAASHDVGVEDNFYSPARLIVKAGERVRWRSVGDAPHTVTTQQGAPAAFDSHPQCNGGADAAIPGRCMTSGGMFDFTFSQAGTYHYYCKLHGLPDTRPDPGAPDDGQPCFMCGTIVVKAASVSPTKPPPSKAPPPPASPSPSATETAADDPTTAPVPSEPSSPTAAPEGTPPPDDDREQGDDETLAAGSGDEGGGGRAAAATVAAVLLLGVGYGLFRRVVPRG